MGGFLPGPDQRAPAGFTAFMFAPLNQSSGTSQELIQQPIREFGGEVDLDESLIKQLTKTQVSLPTTLGDAKTKLFIAIKFLNLITGRKSIASAGYRRALDLMREDCRDFCFAASKDKTLYVKVFHTIDRTFHRLCEKLCECNPVEDL